MEKGNLLCPVTKTILGSGFLVCHCPVLIEMQSSFAEFLSRHCISF